MFTEGFRGKRKPQEGKVKADGKGRCDYKGQGLKNMGYFLPDQALLSALKGFFPFLSTFY